MVSGRMRGVRALFPETGSAGVWRLALTWTLLFAFAMQSYITQTHLHGAPAARAPVTQFVAVVSTPAPADDEAITCPFCQAIAASGAYSNAPPVTIHHPLAITGPALSRPTVAAVAAMSAGFGWRSRAPPQA